MNISIIITNYNGQELLEKNLPAVIKAKEDKTNHIIEIIIVDDASTDDSMQFLKETYKNKIKLFVQPKNVGFAANTNRGVKMAKGDLVCLLNSDVIPQKDFLKTMQTNFLDPQLFAVSLHEEGWGYAAGKFVNGFIIHDGKPEDSELHTTFWASGGSAVFRKSIWEKLNGMDEKTLSPFYWEDFDLSYRAQKRGYLILWDPRANVVHIHESTMKKLNQNYVQNIKERNYLLIHWKNITSPRLMQKHILSLFKKIILHPGYLKIVILALSKIPEVWKARDTEKKQTNVSDEAIFAKF